MDGTITPVMLERSLRWHVGNVEKYSPRCATHDLRKERDTLPWRVKPFCELVFLLLIAKRHAHASDAVWTLERFVFEECRKVEWEGLMAEDPSSSVCVAMVIELHCLHGREPPLSEDQLRIGAESGYFTSALRVPFRMMDYHYTMSGACAWFEADDIRTNFARSVFGKSRCVASYSINDIYSLTHSVFYLADVGRRDIREVLPAKEIARLRASVVSLMVMMLRGDNNDVLGELLICIYMCRMPLDGIERDVFELACRKMANAQVQDGCVPSTRKSIERAASGKALFHEVYHTTLVASIMFLPAASGSR